MNEHAHDVHVRGGHARWARKTSDELIDLAPMPTGRPSSDRTWQMYYRHAISCVMCTAALERANPRLRCGTGTELRDRWMRAESEMRS